MSLTADDMWDPNTWDLTEPEYYVLLTPRLEPRVRVDYVDYVWATQWLWDARYAQKYKNKKKRRRGATGICYAARATARFLNGPGQGRRGANYVAYRENVTLYLHIEIMKRTGIQPPSPEHVLVDHINGNTLDCRRSNLQWATYAMNRRNRRDATRREAHD